MHSGVGCLPIGGDSVNSQVPRGLNWGESTSESTRKTRWSAHSSQPGPPRGWLGRGKPERATWKQVENAALGHPPGGAGVAPGKREQLCWPSGGCWPLRHPPSAPSWLSDPRLTRATTVATLIKLPTLHQTPCFWKAVGTGVKC